MSNQWLRLWHDMPNDPKWRTIARVAKQPISVVLSVYLHILVAASNATERGRTHGMSCEDIASALDVETADVESILSAMQGRVLDGDSVSGWEKRQPLREDGAAERAKAWREAKKKAVGNVANATERAANATDLQDTDTDTDTEKKDQKLFARSDARSKPVDESPVVIGIELNDGTDFPITENQVLEFEGLYPAVNIRQELRSMRAWSISNPTKRKTRSGILRFVNSWLSKAQNEGPRPSQRAGPYANNGGQVGKTMGAIMALEGMKRGLDSGRDSERIAATPLLRVGETAGF